MSTLSIEEIQALIELRDMATKEKLEHRKKANEWAAKARQLDKIIIENSYDKELAEWETVVKNWHQKTEEEMKADLKRAG